MNSVTNHKLLEGDSYKLTVQRRTLLTDARYHALLAKLWESFADIVTETGEPEMIVDAALTTYARLVSQTCAVETFPIALVQISDSSEAVMAAALNYLTNLNPMIAEAWVVGLNEVDASWNAPELQPKAKKLPKNS